MFDPAILVALPGSSAYAGIGSRETPAPVLALMTRIAEALEARGFILRSGGAGGADSAFAAGSREASSEVFLPWQGFNGLRGTPWQPPRPGAFVKPATGALVMNAANVWAEAERLAERFHPAWERLTRGGRALQTRNCFQVLGPDLRTHSRFVVCWTRDGRATGGTGQAIRIASDAGIPVLNLFDPAIRTALCSALGIPVA